MQSFCLSGRLQNSTVPSQYNHTIRILRDIRWNLIRIRRTLLFPVIPICLNRDPLPLQFQITADAVCCCKISVLMPICINQKMFHIPHQYPFPIAFPFILHLRRRFPGSYRNPVDDLLPYTRTRKPSFLPHELCQCLLRSLFGQHVKGFPMFFRHF